MALQPEQRQLLEREHRFAEWRGPSEEATGTEIQGFRFRGDELPGWELAQSRFNPALDPPRLDTFWRPVGTAADALLGVHLIERPTVAAAREALLAVLGDVESARIRRRTDLEIGEVAFGWEGMVAFARRNLVVLVRNAGRRVVDVLDPARRVDATLTRAGGPR